MINRSKILKSVFTLIGLVLPAIVMAAQPEVQYEQITFNEFIGGAGSGTSIAFSFVVLLGIGVLGMLLLMLSLLNKLLSEADAQSESKTSFLSQVLTDMKQKFLTGKLINDEKQEAKEMLMPHDYDGIKELNYGMPPWLQTVFWGTVVFAFGYIINMYVLGGIPSAEEEYQTQVARVAKLKEFAASKINEETVVFDAEAAKIDGKKIFMANCVACHGDKGQGGIGPNMTDDYYIHGGSINDIFSTIKYGVQNKGMISWESKLSPIEMQAVASYVKTLRGNQVEDGKEPQGELFNEE